MVRIVNSRFNFTCNHENAFSSEMLVYSATSIHRGPEWARGAEQWQTEPSQTDPCVALSDKPNRTEPNSTPRCSARFGHLSLISSQYDKLPLEGSEEITTK
jgi:hypothetical protein